MDSNQIINDNSFDEDEIDDDFTPQNDEERDRESFIQTRNQSKQNERQYRIISDNPEKRKMSEQLLAKMKAESQIKKEVISQLIKDHKTSKKKAIPFNFPQTKIVVSEKAILAATEALRPKNTVEKSYKFAGETYKVEMEENEQEHGIDKLVKSINAPKTINTVEKSSIDWEKYKINEGIKDDLEKQAENGYLDQQAFLHRVDERLFEKEKEFREKERAMRQLKETVN